MQRLIEGLVSGLSKTLSKKPSLGSPNSILDLATPKDNDTPPADLNQQPAKSSVSYTSTPLPAGLHAGHSPLPDEIEYAPIVSQEALSTVNAGFDAVKLTLESLHKGLESVPVPGLKHTIGGILKI